MARVCISLGDRSATSLAARVASASALADVVELRLDAMESPERLTTGALVELLGTRVPALVTVRPAWQGGWFAGDEVARMALLERALRAGAWRVDLELDAPGCDEWMAAHRDRTLLSHHWSVAAPEDVDVRIDQILRLRPSIAKLVTPAGEPSDAAPMLRAGRLLRAAGIDASCFCMGEAGRASRLLDAADGGALIYCGDGGTRTAAGQPAARWVREDLAPERWQAGAARYGLLGDPVDRSLSPAIMNAAFAGDGSGASYVPVAASDFETALELAEISGLRGLSVTMPFKAAAARASESRGLAVRIGAVNTLVRSDSGGWEGYNTDGPAVVEALSTEMAPAGRRVLVLGAGGAARAAAVCLRDAGADVLIASRRPGPAQRLAAAVVGSAIDWSEAGTADVDAVINATPVGMDSTDEEPIPTVHLPEACVVMEMIYRPLETSWLRRARERGRPTVCGVEMFLSQAAAQYRLWTGREAPHATMRAVAIDRLAAEED
jgi:3-dehydroquinate dehydratase/shikimate dehydrogenase